MTEGIIATSEGHVLRVNRVPEQNEAEKCAENRAHRNPDRRIKEEINIWRDYCQ